MRGLRYLGWGPFMAGEGGIPSKPAAFVRSLLGGTVIFCLFLAAVDEARLAHYWNAAYWLLAFVVGAVGLFWWVRHEEHREAMPAPLHDLRNVQPTTPPVGDIRVRIPPIPQPVNNSGNIFFGNISSGNRGAGIRANGNQRHTFIGNVTSGNGEDGIVIGKREDADK